MTSDLTGERPATILAEARRLFYERGVDATSMQDIADAVGIHKSTLYHHFRSKEELLERACREPLDRLQATLDAALAREDLPPRQRLLLAFEGAAAVALDDVAGTNVVISQRATGDVGTRVHGWRREYDKRFTELVGTAQAAGQVRNDVDAGLLTRILLGTINWVVTWYRPGTDRYHPEAVQQALSAVIDQGL